MELLLILLVLFLVVAVLEIDFLLQLVDSDLQLNATLPFTIVGFEQVELQTIILLPQILTLLPQVAFYLLALEQLHFKLTDFLLKQGNSLVEQIL